MVISIAGFGFGELHGCLFSLTRKFPASCRNAQVELDLLYGRRRDVGSQGNGCCHKEKTRWFMQPMDFHRTGALK